MEQYANRYGNVAAAEDDVAAGKLQDHEDSNSDDNNLAEFDRLRKARLAAGAQSTTVWQAELRAYLKEVEADVESPDIDVVRWWQVRYLLSPNTFLLTKFQGACKPLSYPCTDGNCYCPLATINTA